MLMALGPKGMSSDESDHKKGFAQYGVFKKEWRNPLITAWLRVFDSLYRRLRLNDVDKNSPGSQPHSRFYSVKTSKRRPPVKGLPKNAYCPTWLAALHPYDRKQLRVQEVDYDFSHDQTMLRYVSCFPFLHAAVLTRCYLPVSLRTTTASTTASVSTSEARPPTSTPSPISSFVIPRLAQV